MRCKAPFGENIMSRLFSRLVFTFLICCAAVALGIFQELAAKRKRSSAMSQIDHEVADLVASYDGHAFNVPNLGLTIADGGDPIGKKDEK